MTKLYSLEAVEKAKQTYINNGGQYIVLEEGSLLDGLAVLICDKFRSIVIKEKYLNSQSSAYTIRQYKVLPEKYQKMLDKIL